MWSFIQFFTIVFLPFTDAFSDTHALVDLWVDTFSQFINTHI